MGDVGTISSPKIKLEVLVWRNVLWSKIDPDLNGKNVLDMFDGLIPPVTVNEPVINTDPVNSCVFVSNDPLRVDPVLNSILDVIVWTFIVCAVNVPATVKLFANELVAANDEDTAFKTYDAVCALATYEADCAFSTYDADCAKVTNEAVWARDAVVANDELKAVNDDVWFASTTSTPFNVIPDPVTDNEPETTTLFFAIIPLRDTNSFAILLL